MTTRTQSGFWDLGEDIPEDPEILELRERQAQSRARCVARHGVVLGELDLTTYDPDDDGSED